MDLSQGLGSDAAALRLAQIGPNQLRTNSVDPWYRVLLRQFHDALIAILACAALVSWSIGETLDAAAILTILALNGLLGFLQEWRAEKALAALREMIAPQCNALRDGHMGPVPVEELVPGDIVSLVAGEKVPADLRLFHARELRLDESALTGESIPVSKDCASVDARLPLADRSSMAWMGTAVTNGNGQGIVVETAMGTEFGAIAALTGTVRRTTTPLQRRLGRLGKQLGLLALAASLLVAITGWLLGRPAIEMFMTGVSLAVAIVPEGLPAVVTVTLALGVRQMVKRRAMPRRLQATETLGAVSTLLTDKTGTLTENEMTVGRIWLSRGTLDVTGSGYKPVGEFLSSKGRVALDDWPDLQALLEAAHTCNHATIEQQGEQWIKQGSPTEAALIVAAHKAGLQGRTVPWTAEHPFNSDRKRMTVVIAEAHGQVAYSKGAPEVLLARCTHVLHGEEEIPMSSTDLERVESSFEAMGANGMRVLALARKQLEPAASTAAEHVEQGLCLLGTVGILDPPRPEVPAAISRAKSSGIRVLMVTGDAPTTAQAIAERIGLPADRVLTGQGIDAMDDALLADALKAPIILARTTPEHKLRIVRILRDEGQIVGMTGDGVNDAPALKQAHIGIAMGIRGTDVARESSDLVILDDNFASIIDAVEEGRREYDNINKFVRYLLSSNIGETVAIALIILLRQPLILLPVQILWINVVTDAVTAIALGLEPPEKDLMRRRPLNPDAPLLSKAGLLSTVGLGSYIGLATLALFLYSLYGSTAHDLITAQTLAFTAMVVLEQTNLFNHRSLRAPLHSVGYWSNPWLLVALGGTVVLQMAAIYLPSLQRVLHTTSLGWRDWGLLLLIALPLFLVPEWIKHRSWSSESPPAPKPHP